MNGGNQLDSNSLVKFSSLTTAPSEAPSCIYSLEIHLIPSVCPLQYILKFKCIPCQPGLEYIDWMPWWRIRSPSPKGYPRYNIKLHLIVRLQFWRSGECRVTTSLSLLPRPLWLGVIIPVRIKSMGPTDLFKNHAHSLGMWPYVKKNS